MDSKEKKRLLLSNLFHHLDGIVLIPTILELEKKQILNHILNNGKSKLSDLSNRFSANEGYLNVALRLLCSQNILEQEHVNEDIIFKDIKLQKWMSLNIANKYKITAPLYTNEINYSNICDDTDSDKINNSILAKTISNYIHNTEQNKLIFKNVDFDFNWQKHIEGIIVAPILVCLARKKMFTNVEIGRELNLNIHNEWSKILMNLFYHVGIIDVKNNISEYGNFLLKRVTSYGVTVSYLPTLKNISHLLYGDNSNRWENNSTEETHVDRSMNVWGSGGAHHTYFKKVDQIIIDLFNLPIEHQPKGFIDIGCGNGKLIEHIFDLIYYKTKRGKYLESNPLFIVGSDFNYKALEATNETINKADIWAKTAFGDISDPDSLAKKLKEKHDIQLSDLLNVRSFLDHNRIYTAPKKNYNKISNSTGSFCYQGIRIKNKDLEQNLKEHFAKWAPYLKKYGLLIVELHTIDPAVSAKNIGKNAITAYDATHGFSDQYIIEYELFLKIALETGLKPDPQHEYTFPSRDIPIVSINRLL